MVRTSGAQLSRPHHPSVQDSNDYKARQMQTRPRRNRSPRFGQGNHEKSPRRHSPRHSTSDKRVDFQSNSRSQHRREIRGNDPHTGSRDSRSVANSSTNNNQSKRSKWRRTGIKKKRRGKGGKMPPLPGGKMPPLSGGNCAPVSGNRQPIASMRMRMDDYITPRMGRLLPIGKKHVVARARREASTRTKDTFWTKKLLDAESSHPNRWAHSGFKELYREELGYSEEKMARRSPSARVSRGEDYDRKSGSKKMRTSPSNKQRPSPDRISSSRRASNLPLKTKNDTRKRGIKSRSRSLSRSPRGRNLPPSQRESNLSKSHPGNRKQQAPYLRQNKMSYPHNLSRSPSSSISSRSRSSYSSYSRSSSSSSFSSSSSSTFSSSTSGTRRNFRRRSYSRSSKSWSKSPPSTIPRILPKIKTASLSKAVQSVHSKKEKKKKTKTVTNAPPPKNFFPNTSSIVKAKAKPPRVPPTEVPPRPRPPTNMGPPAIIPSAPPTASPTRFYDKEVAVNKSPVYIENVDKLQFKGETRRGIEPPNLKVVHSNRDLTTSQTVSTRSEGEQSNSDSSSEDDGPMKMTLSERFGKLAQLSSQRQEYEGVRMKIVREGGQDKKVYLEGGGSRSPTPHSRRGNVAHEKWLREHKAEYDEYEERYGEFRHWDPHRDLPRELPPNWDDVNVRYRYYKESGYFGERSITMEDYLKWEEWWYRYRDWLEKYGGTQEETLKYRGPYSYDVTSRSSTRDRWIRRDKEDRKRHHRY